MPKTNIKFLITTLSVIFSLIFIATPTYATTSVTTDKAVATTTEPKANQIIKELEQAGFTKQVTGNKRQETITLTKDGVTVTLTHVTQQTRNSTDRWVIGVTDLYYGTDAWGFYLKAGWSLQAALVAVTSVVPGGVPLKAALRVILPALLKGAVKFAGSLDGVVKDVIDMLSWPCPPFQPRYIRFDPFRTKCG